MLGKLMKHEWKATRRILLPLNLTILLITLVGCIILGTNILHGENSLPLVILLLALYALSMIILIMASNIYLMVRFYKNLFTREGYLMFTLPVTSTQLLNSKLIVGYLWTVLNILITMISIFVLSFSSSYYTAVHNGLSDNSNAFLAGFASVISDGTQSTVSFQDIFGYGPLELLLMCMLTFLITSFFSLTMGYLAISLGQLIEKYKLACSIGFYIAFYIGTQIISSVVMIIINLHTLLDSMADPFEITRNIYGSFLPASTILYLILGISFYIITLFILRKKVNLD